jgi:hypothetical protein
MSWRDWAAMTVAQLSNNMADNTVLDTTYWQTYAYQQIKDILTGMVNPDVQDATNGDTTPDVTNISNIRINQAVTITNFDGGVDGQFLWVLPTVDNVIITHNASNIFLANSISWPMNTDYALLLQYDDENNDRWVERHRKTI